MAIFYIRVRHYIAAYLRNFDDKHTIPPDKPITIEQGDPLSDILRKHLYRATLNYINIDCLSERQMLELRKGNVLHKGHTMQMNIARDPRTPPSMSEIYTLCGRTDLVKDTIYNDEYVPFRLPSSVIIDGHEQRITSDFILLSAEEFKNELRRRFGCAMSAFVSYQLRTTRNVAIEQFVYDDTPYGKRKRLQRSKMESLDRFILRYSIRDDDNTRELLKKMLNRDIGASINHYHNDVELARWDLDNPPDEHSFSHSQLRMIICINTGIIYRSVAEAAASNGIKYKTLWMALTRHRPCKKLIFEDYDPNQPKTPSTLL